MIRGKRARWRYTVITKPIYIMEKVDLRKHHNIVKERRPRHYFFIETHSIPHTGNWVRRNIHSDILMADLISVTSDCSVVTPVFKFVTSDCKFVTSDCKFATPVFKSVTSTFISAMLFSKEVTLAIKLRSSRDDIRVRNLMDLEIESRSFKLHMDRIIQSHFDMM